jgi:hypothetical protein
MIWTLLQTSIGEGFINRTFSYVKCRYESDIVKGQHCNDKNSEKGQIDG